VQHLVPRPEGLDPVPGAGHRDGAGAQRVGVVVEHDPAVVDEQHVLEQVGDLLDEVRREQDRPRVLGVVGQQPVVEQLPGDGVQTQVRLVEQRQRGARGQPDDDAHRGVHAARELLDGPLLGQVEVPEQRVGQVVVPVREEHGGRLQRVPHPEVVGVALTLLDERHLRQHGVVLEGAGTEHLDAAAGGHPVPGEQLHQRRLAGTVAAEQTGDRVLLEDGADVVQRDLVAEAHGDALEPRDGGHCSPPFSASIARTSVTEMPSLPASASSGTTYWSANSLRRRFSS
jgi:hypothetical protein